MTRLHLERIPSPCGDLVLAVDGECLHGLYFADHEEHLHAWLRAQHGKETQIVERDASSQISRSLEAYFSGNLRVIDDITVETGGTAFQREVWAALRTIPAGTTLSYSALALQIGSPESRARRRARERREPDQHRRTLPPSDRRK